MEERNKMVVTGQPPHYGKAPSSTFNLSQKFIGKLNDDESQLIVPPNMLPPEKVFSTALIFGNINNDGYSKFNTNPSNVVVSVIPNITTTPSTKVDRPQNVTTQPKKGRDINPHMEPKKMKRILANRESAQRSRIKKLEYTTQLERTVDCLRDKINSLTPQVACHEQQRNFLTLENNAIKQKIASVISEISFKDEKFVEPRNIRITSIPLLDPGLPPGTNPVRA
ncbi:hypothetical protein IFM89_012240 [Coptis chinensis]|uniref:BZIP domain-containing protein n=1 Tax=Coptis chinensis TaxID=261450 RepID=A0A835HDK9_9MAGN|nr:hypothetical protein IFM89_012240 [Coptis chinensis]